MLRASRLVKNVALSNSVRQAMFAPAKMSVRATSFHLLRFQHTEAAQTAESVKDTVSEAAESRSSKNPRSVNPRPEVTPELKAQRAKEVLDLTAEINETIKKDASSGEKSLTELNDYLFSKLDKHRFLKNRYSSIRGFYESVDLLINQSIKEIANPNQTKIPLTPEEILNKAVFYGIASPLNFNTVAKYYLSQGQSQDVLPLWVSYVEFKSSNSYKFLYGEQELRTSVIIAYTELMGDSNPQIENIKQLLQVDELPPLNVILKVLNKIIPRSEPRHAKLEKALNVLMVASRDPNSLRDLKRAYEAIGYGRERLAVSIYRDTLNISEVSGKPIALETFVAYMTIFNQLNKSSEVINIWSKIQKSGLEPSIDAWNQLLEASAKVGPFQNRIGQAQGVFEKIKNPNPETYAKLYEIYSQYKEDELAQSLATPANMKSAIFVNTYLKTLSTSAEIETLEKLFKKFQNAKVNLEISTYNKLLSRYVKVKEFSKAKRVLNEMETYHVKPDVATYSIILDILLKSIISKGDIPTMKAIDDILTEMKETGIEVNNFTLTSIVDSLSKDASSFRNAEFVFDALKEKKQENSVSYVALITNAFSIGKVDSGLKYFEQFLNSSYELTEANWSMLFQGLCKNDQVESSRVYLTKLAEIPNYARLLNRFSYFFLLRTARNNKSAELANDIFKVLIDTKYPVGSLSKTTKETIWRIEEQGVPIPEEIKNAL